MTTGIDLRLNRLFEPSGRAVVVAVDHGMFDGPHAGMENIGQALEHLGAGPDAILLSPGSLRRCGHYFGRRGAPQAIVRLNMNTVFQFQWSPRHAAISEAYPPLDAMALGADMVLVCLTLKSGDERQDAHNMEVFSRLCVEAHRLGLPVMGEYFPLHHNSKSPEEFHEEIMIGVRTLEEFGADCVKTFHTAHFGELTSKINIPVLGLGAEKTPTDLEALQLAWREVNEGARGVVFGRNAIQASNPPAFVAALGDVVKSGKSAEEAAEHHGLTGSPALSS